MRGIYLKFKIGYNLNERIYFNDIGLIKSQRGVVSTPVKDLYSVGYLTEHSRGTMESRAIEVNDQMFEKLNTVKDPVYLEILIKLILNNDNGTEN